MTADRESVGATRLLSKDKGQRWKQKQASPSKTTNSIVYELYMSINCKNARFDSLCDKTTKN